MAQYHISEDVHHKQHCCENVRSHRSALISAYPKKLSYMLYEYFLKLDVIVFQDEVRSQDSAHVIASVAINKHGRRLAWNFFKENWRELMNRYPVCVLLLSP